MEIESLFSSTRWEIIKALARDKLSPMELAAKTKTTSANISQQLRLLELAGLVRSEKTSNVERGKPRVVYMLAGNMAFLILSSPHFASKRLLSLTEYHTFVMRSWFLDNFEHHSLVTDFYVRIKDVLHNIDVIVASSTPKELTIYIIEDKKLDSVIKKSLGDLKKVRVLFVSLDELKKKYSPDHVVLYDPYNKYSKVVRSD